MRLSVIIPVFNEAATVERIIDAVFGVSLGAWEKQVIVVDDGSQDASSTLLNALQKKYDFVLLAHSKNRGKGAAVTTALARADGDAVIIQDADLEYNPQDWPSMLAAFERGNPVVYGSRERSGAQHGYRAYAWGASILTGLCNLLYGSQLTDMYTCYKLIRTDIFRNANVTADGFELCPELTARILLAGHTILEVGIQYRPRSFSEGKKIRFWDGARGAWTLVRCRITRF